MFASSLHAIKVNQLFTRLFTYAFYPQMKNADYFSNYVTEDFTTYINRKRKNNCHGNHIEMQAMAEMYNRPVEVYQYGTGEDGGRAPALRFVTCEGKKKLKRCG